MGVRDKCVADRTRSTVTYLCFSGNFTRLGVALKKGSYSLLWSGRTGSPATTTVDFLSNPRESFGHWASWSADESGVYSLTDSAEAHKSSNCWPMAVTGDGATCGESRIDRNHRSSLSASADHLGIHLLSASKLTGNFACIAAASMATKCSHWTRIGAINRMTRTTRDPRNNKWTVLEQRTRPQDEEQVPTLPQSLTLPLAEGVPLYAWQGSSNASALNSLLTAAPMYASLTSRPLTGCNAFNKLMTKTVHGVQARMMSTASLALIPCSHRLDSRLLLETASIATFPCSTVSGGVICKLRRMCLLILRAPCNQPCSSLWTSSGRFDNRRWYVLDSDTGQSMARSGIWQRISGSTLSGGLAYLTAHLLQPPLPGEGGGGQLMVTSSWQDNQGLLALDCPHALRA